MYVKSTCQKSQYVCLMAKISSCFFDGFTSLIRMEKALLMAIAKYK